jgi:hypothetical protein
MNIPFDGEPLTSAFLFLISPSSILMFDEGDEDMDDDMDEMDASDVVDAVMSSDC